MKESIRTKQKTILALVFIFFLGFTGQVKALGIRPLLGTDIAIVGEIYYEEVRCQSIASHL